MRAEIRELDESDLEAAGQLLAQRHRRHRERQPLLSPRFEDPETATEELRGVWASKDASGTVALAGGELVGYLLGVPKDSPVWGPNVWVEPAGQAVTGDPELMRDLYAAAATRWVEEGRTAQYVLVPATDPGLVAAWFRLGFGHQQTHAVRRPLDREPAVAPGVRLRLAVRDDIPVLARLDVALPEHQGLAPCFSSGETGTVEEAAQEWEEDWENPDFTTYVAELDGTVVGSAVLCSISQSSGNTSLIRPDDCGYFAFAAVMPEARGRGVGRALGELGLSWAGREGYAVVATDWRQTNLLSSRAWPALGYEDTFWRLHRTVGY
ncbi:GNAT family N-acetyltransferase [Nocardioides mesophilus]|uniref:GNAT family N-acetyltransferase n=1 Tax=Nocardioides mesophilus TaxID=433659 RepID=A0A7G9RBZ7_9ACTN|nr:GNAT family N-acetyltransferase [Nocardioides mesophilus]QNN53122.1 GNAT family N-acetyltransferase [Nocardioides mesophilus]